MPLGRGVKHMLLVGSLPHPMNKIIAVGYMGRDPGMRYTLTARK